MARVAPVVPAEADILCEGCGYTLNGLPESGNCPECGKPIALSTVEDRRFVPTWEQPDHPPLSAFIGTTLRVLFRPTQFYRTLATRADTPAARRFAVLHWLMAAVMFAAAAYFHATWYTFSILLRGRGDHSWVVALGVGLLPVTYLALDYITRLAARLTAWEAAYRGIRLPNVVVLRALHYHAAHYVPVAAMAVGTVLGYRLLLETGTLQPSSAMTYLYVLSGEVIAGAFYLFNTYWIGMRNMMYANR